VHPKRYDETDRIEVERTVDMRVPIPSFDPLVADRRLDLTAVDADEQKIPFTGKEGLGDTKHLAWSRAMDKSIRRERLAVVHAIPLALVPVPRPNDVHDCRFGFKSIVVHALPRLTAAQGSYPLLRRDVDDNCLRTRSVHE